KRSEPDGLELLDQIRPGGLVRVRAGHGDLLIETRQGVGETARKPQRPAEKNPLAVVDVVQEFPDGPLVGRVTVRRALFGNACQKRRGLFELIVEKGNDVVGGREIDVAKIVGGGFVCLWLRHASDLTKVPQNTQTPINHQKSIATSPSP